MKVEILKLLLKILSRILYGGGILTMFIPMTQYPEPELLWIPIGAFTAFCGILLMKGPENYKFRSNEDILDENIFEEEARAE